MTSTAPSPLPPARLAGLDGLRAIAVILVVAYHLFPPAVLPGGFIGVDVFFVISGFLITSLLLRERAATGAVALGRFWQRRARRLLPALAVVVAVCSTLAWIVGGDVLVRLDAQVLGAATFSFNWVSLAGGGGYFSAAAPELFRNFWSLAVEEQFYLLWPVVFPLFLLLPRAWARAAAAFALALASAVWMGAVIAQGGDLTRAYFGTDTHASGLLLGVGLAFLLAPLLGAPRSSTTHVLAETAPRQRQEHALSARTHVLDDEVSSMVPRSLPGAAGASSGASGHADPAASRPQWTQTVVARRVVDIAGVAALGGIVVLASLPWAGSTAAFPGALLAASVLTAVAITAGVWPGGRFGRAIDLAPLRWVGDRSYGIYLWHWPLLVLTMATVQGSTTTAVVPVPVGLGVLALTLAASTLSHRFIETPVRRRGFRASLRALWRRLQGGPRARLRVLGAALAAVLVLAGTGAALAAAPEESSAEAAVDAGRRALAHARVSPAITPTPIAAPADGSVSGDEISAIGDSVMLASAGGLMERLPGIEVDAEVSRPMRAGPGIVDRLLADGRLRPYVVIALGTNGPVDHDALARIAHDLGPDRGLVLVNAFAPRDWIPGVNADLQAFAAARPNVVVADWAGAIAAHEDLLAGDRIHPGEAGGRIFADTVADAVDRLAEARREHAELFIRLQHARLDPTR
ncbi:acetyltransferase [Microbacterium sp. NEAU-LLC]|uniref:Acetyltransferase n=1 Tax=Microbacterium helvum TaxID=2773713 RepID=A0ABR8NQ62_9MICO|nr:acyltransferase family protein [Microbacterium helvum]MBD3942593.1 acetyltransferase [Microbacterium helvum]